MKYIQNISDARKYRVIIIDVEFTLNSMSFEYTPNEFIVQIV